MEEVTEKNSSLKKEFESLLVKDLSNRHFKEGEIITGVVEEISKKFVYVDLGSSFGAFPFPLRIGVLPLCIFSKCCAAASIVSGVSFFAILFSFFN